MGQLCGKQEEGGQKQQKALVSQSETETGPSIKLLLLGMLFIPTNIDSKVVEILASQLFSVK
jgi:hypothetical protein